MGVTLLFAVKSSLAVFVVHVDVYCSVINYVIHVKTRGRCWFLSSSRVS